MNKFDVDEPSRLAALLALRLLETAPEARFDRFTAIASAALGAPIALVSLIDSERQWCKARLGLAMAAWPRAGAPCDYTIEGHGSFIVNDAALDRRFAAHRLVVGEPGMRFYAGHPLRSSDGHAVGTLCVIDTVPRVLSAAQAALLPALAAMVEEELWRDSASRARLAAASALHALNGGLQLRLAESHAALLQKNEALNREIRQRADVEASLRASQARVRSMIDASCAAYVATDAAGHIVEWNCAAARIFGWSRAEVLGRPWSSIMVGVAPTASAGGHGGAGVRLVARTSIGAEIVVEMTVEGFSVDGQHFLGAFINDVSGQIASSRALEQKQELLDAVLDTVDVAVVACDGTGKLSFFNRAAREFHGRAPGPAPSLDWAGDFDLYQADGETPLLPGDIPLVRALAGERVQAMRMVIAPPGRPRRTVLASGRLMRSAAGERLGAVIAMQDITELSASKDRLRNSERMLRSIAENLPTMIGQVDRHGRFVYLNARALGFYGKPAEQLLGRTVRSVYSEADYVRIAPHVEAAASGRRAAFDNDITIDGKQFYYHASFVPQRDAQGRPDGFFAMAFDITARRHSELAQRDSEERLRTITDNVPVLISYLDCSLRYQFANAMYRDWLGVASAQMIGRSVVEVFGQDYFDERAPSIRRALGGHMANVEVKVMRKGHERILNTTYMPHQRDGRVVGVYVLATDATAARQHERRLQALANADPLTNLPNRRMYEFHLAKALALAKRQQTRLALMYLDLDDFKRINDTHGHGAGDAVLVEFGKRVGANLRQSDLLARLAGDEFTVVLEAVDSVGNCEVIAHKIQQALQAPYHYDGRALQISASIGIALADNDATMASLSSQADQALYVAKRKGKSRYAVLEQCARRLDS